MALVLLVDDHQPMLRLISAMLARLGHDVVTAINGDDALRKFGEHRFDLVITDLIMPEREGLDTIRELRRESDIRIIAMSSGGATGPANYLRMAERLGAVAVLAKPFSQQELGEALEVALRSPTSSSDNRRSSTPRRRP